MKEKLRVKEAAEHKHSVNFEEEQKALMGSLGDDAGDTDSLQMMRVNDLDIKAAVDGLEGSEDEDLEDETGHKKKNGKQK